MAARGFGYQGPIAWFPGHQVSALRAIRDKLRHVDVVIEVRDARIPLSSANPELAAAIGDKARVLVFNKADLANPNMNHRVQHLLDTAGQPAVFTTATDKGANVQKIIPLALQHMKSRSTGTPHQLLVVGMPNLGKSSLINAIRRKYGGLGGSGAKTGGLPGITRHVSGFVVSRDPYAVLLDTPGIMVPRIEDKDVGLKLAVTGAIRDHLVGEEVMAEFLLFSLNASGSATLTRAINFDSTVENISALLQHVASSQGLFAGGSDGQSKVLDSLAASKWVLRQFRTGALGRYTLDSIDGQISAQDILSPPSLASYPSEPNVSCDAASLGQQAEPQWPAKTA